jgi:hypothetical protein
MQTRSCRSNFGKIKQIFLKMVPKRENSQKVACLQALIQTYYEGFNEKANKNIERTA